MVVEVARINQKKEREEKDEEFQSLTTEIKVVEILISNLHKADQYMKSVELNPNVLTDKVKLIGRKRVLINKQIQLGGLM
jgi:hypothetical protein